MSQKNFELPLPSEKLSHKFILDSLKEQPSVVGEAEIEIQCGTEAAPITLDETFSPPLSNSILPEGKKYFRIGEVASLVGVEAYVLRYWETEFKSIKPTKSKAGQRVYARKDVETLLEIKHLLHEERFSIKGAKQKLIDKKKEVKAQRIQEAPKHQVLRQLQNELKELLTLAKQAV